MAFFIVWFDWVLYNFLLSNSLAIFLSSCVLGYMYFSNFVFDLSFVIIVYKFSWYISIFFTSLFSFKRFFTKNYRNFHIELYDCNGEERIEKVNIIAIFPMFKRWFLSLLLIDIAFVLLIYFLNRNLFESLNAYYFAIFSIFGLGSFVLAYMFITCKNSKIVRD